MEITIKRLHTTKKMQEALNKLTSEDITNAIIKGLDSMTKTRIKRVETSIQESFEEAKMDEKLKPTILQLDFSSLKQIDALMRRYRHCNDTTSIRPENLSNSAINLYVVMVRKVYIATVGKCSREYTMQELSIIANSLLSFNQKMTTFSPVDKDKKFYAAKEAMNTLTKVNFEVSKRISSETENAKKMMLAK